MKPETKLEQRHGESWEVLLAGQDFSDDSFFLFVIPFSVSSATVQGWVSPPPSLLLVS